MAKKPRRTTPPGSILVPSEPLQDLLRSAADLATTSGAQAIEIEHLIDALLAQPIPGLEEKLYTHGWTRA